MRNWKKWTLEQKVGQLFMAGFDGLTPTDGILDLIRENSLGGVIYFRRNIGDPEQVARLSQTLQEKNAEAGDAPLFIAIDQEGGMVSRIDRDVTLIPGAMALGAAGSAELAYQTAKISGRELRLLGINVNFAPSLDVNNNPLNPVIGVRSYGEDPAFVGELGTAAVRGYQEAGVAATVKHFPGHGDTEFDSHYGLPLIAHDAERLERVELAPFRRAIAEGTDAVMTAHVIFPAFEPESLPGTLSPNVVTGLLRSKLGYDGVVFSDCMEMHAISRHFGVAEGAVLAVEAGVDVVLVSHTLEEQRAAIGAVIAAVRGGRISEARIDESVERILALKEQRGMDRTASEPGALSGQLGRAEDWRTVREASEQSITLVKDTAGNLPLRRDEPTLVVWAEPREATQVVEIIEQEATLGAALRPYLAEVRELRIGLDPGEAAVRELLEATAGYSQVVVATHNPVSRLPEGQVRLVQQLAERSGLRLVVASTRNPYDLNEFPAIPTYLAAYENRPQAMTSLARVLAGEIPARGKLPVTISAAAAE
ncbi:beta-N-acetylhexosaminidase [Gorillibacterium timonense]|uniref:beta-N-acetylhexosaminidase n=1 Tax=Gorillibacterium timonense TaxID=1689269 RepID=UPI00071D9981|nr:beta-N-acetylhexosaminidase [Gorillibacterium timonense]